MSVPEGGEVFVVDGDVEEGGGRGDGGAVLGPGAGVRVAALRVLAVRQTVWRERLSGTVNS